MNCQRVCLHAIWNDCDFFVASVLALVDDAPRIWVSGQSEIDVKIEMNWTATDAHFPIQISLWPILHRQPIRLRNRATHCIHMIVGWVLVVCPTMILSMASLALTTLNHHNVRLRRADPRQMTANCWPANVNLSLDVYYRANNGVCDRCVPLHLAAAELCVTA